MFWYRSRASYRWFVYLLAVEGGYGITKHSEAILDVVSPLTLKCVVVCALVSLVATLRSHVGGVSTQRLHTQQRED